MLQAPFPYFGGKSAIASVVWKALGQPKHYIEPFFGSGAVLLARPDYDPTQYVETVCDKDGFIANIWRSLQLSPDEVAKWCDWPVNHADLMARRLALRDAEGELLEKLVSDDMWHNPKIAGYWIWAASCWIGSGMTRWGAMPYVSSSGMGVHKLSQIPPLADSGTGVHKSIPHLINGGKGIHKLSCRDNKIPMIAHGGKGIHGKGKRPHICDAGKGIHKSGIIKISKNSKVTDLYNSLIYSWFRQLSERLRYIRVVCGDWTRVCGGNWQDKMGDVGVFFDPPYSDGLRDKTLYNEDSLIVANDVRSWCINRGNIPTYRIVLAGYEGEHNELEDLGWTKHKWKAQGGYSVRIGSNSGQNRFRERLWLSPHCKKINISGFFYE